MFSAFFRFVTSETPAIALVLQDTVLFPASVFWPRSSRPPFLGPTCDIPVPVSLLGADEPDTQV